MVLLEIWNMQKPHWTPETYIRFYVLAGMIFLLMMLVVQWKGYSKRKSIAVFLLMIYLILVYASTVFSRQTGLSTAQYEGKSIPFFTGPNYQLEPFWTLRWGIEVFGKDFIWECLLNILMLMPVGFLLPFALSEKKSGIIMAAATGFGFLVSLSIELLQLFLKRGLCEFDDLFYNTIGVIISCTLWLLFRRTWIFYERKRKKD